MRQRIWAGPAPGKIIGKWVGQELEAKGFKPSTSRDVSVPVVGKGCEENREVKGEIGHGGRGEKGKREATFHKLVSDWAVGNPFHLFP